MSKSMPKHMLKIERISYWSYLYRVHYLRMFTSVVVVFVVQCLDSVSTLSKLTTSTKIEYYEISRVNAIGINATMMRLQRRVDEGVRSIIDRNSSMIYMRMYINRITRK